MATHVFTGECQVCGRHQAIGLKSECIAKHGYTTRWGFFSGTCPGSDYRPLEVANDRLHHGLEMARMERSRQTARIAEICAMPADHGFESEYIKAEWGNRGRRIPSRHVTHVVRFEEEVVKCADDFQYTRVHAYTLDENSRELGHPRDRHERTVAEAVAKSRDREIRTHLARIGQMDEYIAWQQNRIDTWAPRPLTPVKSS